VDGAPPYERHIPLEGAVNFRDLGGYAAEGGRTIRWRTLFRADGLSHLTTPDRALVRQLGIATVIDLRSRPEVDAGRFPVEEIPVGFHHLPLVTALPAAEEFRRAPGFLASHYQDMARDAGPQIGQALAIVARRHAHPVIVHCAAGKDRTGVLVAVLLALLGVDDETIAADYALSARAMAELAERLIARNPENREFIETVGQEALSATPQNITALLGALRRQHGSVAAYAAVNGAGPEVVAALRETLLEPAP
jgi:protein-tyrosine phosphatase